MLFLLNLVDVVTDLMLKPIKFVTEILRLRKAVKDQPPFREVRRRR